MRVLMLFMVALAGWHLDAAVVTLFDGTSRTGDDLRIDAAKRTLTLGGGSVALSDCDVVVMAAGPRVPLTEKRGLWLNDGGWLPMTALRAAAAPDTLAIEGPLGAMEIPLTAVLGWGEGDLPDKPAKDVVSVASGAPTGQVQGIQRGKLLFQGDGGVAYELDLKDVRALRLALPAKPVKGIVLTAQLDETHAPLALLPGSPLHLAAAPEVAIATIPAGVDLRVDGGRRVYLSALDPATVAEVGAFGVVWPHRRDRNLDGEPLRLSGVRYARGLSLHSQAALTWKLDGAYTRLRAWAGIADETGGEGDCAVSILGDEKPLWHRDNLTGHDKPARLDLDLSGVQTLTITVAYGARYDIGDRVTLADAYLVKK